MIVLTSVQIPTIGIARPLPFMVRRILMGVRFTRQNPIIQPRAYASSTILHVLITYPRSICLYSIRPARLGVPHGGDPIPYLVDPAQLYCQKKDHKYLFNSDDCYQCLQLGGLQDNNGSMVDWSRYWMDAHGLVGSDIVDWFLSMLRVRPHLSGRSTSSRT